MAKCGCKEIEIMTLSVEPTIISFINFTRFLLVRCYGQNKFPSSKKTPRKISHKKMCVAMIRVACSYIQTESILTCHECCRLFKNFADRDDLNFAQVASEREPRHHGD